MPSRKDLPIIWDLNHTPEQMKTVIKKLLTKIMNDADDRKSKPNGKA